MISKRFSRGLKNATYLTIGNFIIRVLTLIAFIYIPNKLGNEKYGWYVASASIVTLFSFISFGGLTKVILREASKDIEGINNIINDIFTLKVLLTASQIIMIIMMI